MDTAVQRKNMVESQVRPSDVTDRRIVRAMLDVPREAFVPERVQALAYMDGPVALGAAESSPGRALLAPRTFAKLVQAAQVEPDGAVLVVGAGSGYGAAVLSQFSRSVVALEADETLVARAGEALAKTGAANVQVMTGPLDQGWASEGPYDAIVVEGAVEVMPPVLLDQLKDGGRLVAISAAGKAMRATVWRRDGATFGSADIFDASAPVLPGFARTAQFAF